MYLKFHVLTRQSSALSAIAVIEHYNRKEEFSRYLSIYIFSNIRPDGPFSLHIKHKKL